MENKMLDVVCLVFVIEGILPFISPDTFKKILKYICKQDSNAIRKFGLTSIVFGAAILYIRNQWDNHNKKIIFYTWILYGKKKLLDRMCKKQ